jgi:hypothetical protein
MSRFVVLLVAFFIYQWSIAQELRATVSVNFGQVPGANQQLFRTLQNSLTEFLNDTQWTNRSYANQERINCSFVLIISSQNSNQFSGTLQIQASRPVFNSSYQSIIYNFNDRHINFEYTEFESLRFNPNSFESNLTSIFAFHVYTILGLDASTFELTDTSNEYHETAKKIVNVAASGSYAGWKSSDGNQSRYQLNNALTAQIFAEFHNTMYRYHRLGLDQMADNAGEGKKNIAEAINGLRKIDDSRPNSFLLRVFFDSKAEEIEKIFSGGPSVEISQLVTNLSKMAPTKRQHWQKIKY